ncbi:MAG: NUDIX hydrolase [Chitinophagaceae bacterium]|jgi:8-oxo-dGTP pyrophosphatase MutT (NUDIX family)
MALKEIIAAGGLVFNSDNKLLLIFRRGFWDLPKGKLDDGETIEACAVREVEEEVGLKNILLQNFIETTSHTYFDKWIGEDVVKKTYWYKMQVPNQDLVLQTEEDIEKAVWINENEWKQYKDNCYQNIQYIVEKLWF